MIDGAEVERLIREVIAEVDGETQRLRGHRDIPLKLESTRATLIVGMANRAMGLYGALEIIQTLRRRRKRPA